MNRFTHSMERLVPAVAMAAAIYGSGAEPGAAPMPDQGRIDEILAEYHSDPIPLQYEQVIKDAFMADSAYWRSKGVPLRTGLEILTGDEIATCKGIAITHSMWSKDPGEAEYCPGSDNVVLSEGFVYYITGHYTKSPNIAKAALRLVVSHELGHADQQTKRQLEPENTETLGHHAGIEVDADCLGGVALAAEYPDDVELASTTFADFSVKDVQHGLPVQRYESFMQGAKRGNCSFGLSYGPFASPLAPGIPTELPGVVRGE